MFDVGQAGKDLGRIWGSEAPSALGIWSLRCPFADHGEQAVSESPSSGTCHPAVGGPGVSGGRDRGWGTAPWGHQGLSGNGGRTSKEAEEESPGRWEEAQEGQGKKLCYEEVISSTLLPAESLESQTRLARS